MVEKQNDPTENTKGKSRSPAQIQETNKGHDHSPLPPKVIPLASGLAVPSVWRQFQLQTR
jgi:hypothetical protein